MVLFDDFSVSIGDVDIADEFWDNGVDFEIQKDNTVKSITVTGRGATFETIHGSELQAGLYIYSLVTDGKLVGSKQMVLTE